MNDKEFADRFFIEALKNGFSNTSRGNIACPHKKNLSKHMLEQIHQALGSNCPNAKSEELKKVGIQPCCFTTFRQIAALIYP
jgi:hypothetical protein